MKLTIIILLLFVAIIGDGQSTELRPSSSTSKEYVDNQIDWLKIYLEAEVRAQKEAVSKVATETAARFEAQNEWRGQFKDQAAKFPTRAELWSAVIGLGGLMLAGMKYMRETQNKQLKS